MTVCHVYDKEENHVAFDKLAPEESQPVTFLKRVMPVHACFFVTHRVYCRGSFLSVIK